MAVLLAPRRSFGFGAGVEALARWRRLPAVGAERGCRWATSGGGCGVADASGFSEVALDEGLLLGMARWRWRARPAAGRQPPGAAPGLALVQGRNRQLGYTLVGRDWAPALTAGVELAAAAAGGRPDPHHALPATHPSAACRTPTSTPGNAGGVVFELGYRVGL